MNLIGIETISLDNNMTMYGISEDRLCFFWNMQLQISLEMYIITWYSY